MVGTFQAQKLLATKHPLARTPIVDMNGDGVVDVVGADALENFVQMVFGKGVGTFQGIRSLPVGLSPGGLVTADLNGDGTLDIATANFESNDVSVLLHTSP